MTEPLFQSRGEFEHHDTHAFAFGYIGQGSPHDLTSLAKEGMGAAVARVSAQQAVKAELFTHRAHQSQEICGQGECEEQTVSG